MCGDGDKPNETCFLLQPGWRLLGQFQQWVSLKLCAFGELPKDSWSCQELAEFAVSKSRSQVAELGQRISISCANPPIIHCVL